MTCAAPYTNLGILAPDPFTGVGAPAVPGACGSAENSERFVTVAEMAAHPRGCKIQGYEDMARWALGAVSDRVDEFYGEPQGPCLGVRGFRSRDCGHLDISPALRIDMVEVGPCGCGQDQTWTELDLCDVVVHSMSGLPPYRRLTNCSLCTACGNSQVRITGVWGKAWPVADSIKMAVVTVATKLFQSSKESGKVLVNNLDGTTSYNVPDFSMAELTGLLSRKGARYVGVRV